MREERNSEEEETRNKMEQESDSEEDETSPMRWFQMVIKGKTVPEPEKVAKKLTEKEPGLGEGPVLMLDPRWFRYCEKFGPMLAGSSSCHKPSSREVLGEHEPAVIHKKKDIGKMAGRMEVPRLRSRTLQNGVVIGERTPLLIHEKPQIDREHESRAVEPEDVHWYDRLCSLEIPDKYKRFIKLACDEKLMLSAKDPSIGLMCTFCGEDVETAMHCLWECSNAIQVWSMSPLSWLVLLLLASTFRDLLCDATTVLEDDYDLSLFVLICWCMWEARNDLEQEEVTAMDPQAIVKNALHLLGKKPSRIRSFFTRFCIIL